MSIITLTKQDTKFSSGDVPLSVGAGAPEMLQELHDRFLSMIGLGMELDIAIHPALLDDVLRMAEILDVDEKLIPTERNLLFRS